MFARIFFFALFISASSAFTLDYDKIDTEHEKAIFITLLVVCGLILNFFGVQFFKITLFIFTFIGGFVLSVEFLGPLFTKEYDPYAYLIGFWVGLAFAFLSVTILTFGLLLVGFSLGAVFAGISYLAFLHYIPDVDDIVLYTSISVAGLAGCVIGYKANRLFFAVATSVCGGYCTISGIDLACNRQLTVENVQNNELDYTGWLLLAGWFILFILGTIYQLRSESHPEQLEGRQYQKMDNQKQNQIKNKNNDPFVSKI